MTRRRALLLSATASFAVLSAAPALAQDRPSPTGQGDVTIQDDEPEANLDDSAITVVGNRLPQQIDAPQPPIAELNEQDIAAYGASSVADLIQQLTPEVSSGRGRGGGFPAILVNGMRISNFREMRSYPPEAIRKIEVLPEEVALRYGYSANQRVINIILKKNFTSTEVENEYGQPWKGGYFDNKLDATLLRINGDTRLNLDASGSITSPLTEAERNIVEPASLIPTVSTDPDPATQRTLVGKGSEYSLTGSYTMGFGKPGGSLAFNAQVDKTHGLDRQGFNMVSLSDGTDTALRVVNPDSPIYRKNDTLSLSAGAALSQHFGDWDFQATLDASKVNSDTYTDKLLDTSGLVADALAGTLPLDATLPVLPDAGQDYAKSVSKTLNSLVTMIGRPVMLPAGEVTMTWRGGYGLTQYDSSNTRTSTVATTLKRTSWNTGLNLGIPLTSRNEAFLGALGDFSLNFNGGLTKLSDFGTLRDWTAGVSWNPFDRLGFQASYIYDESAPGLSQLGGPEVVRQGVPVYDFTNGQTVLVQTISGGNPDLLRETDRDIKLSANWELPFASRSRLQVEYFYNRSFNVTAGFPSILTPAIEAAFPDRVTRDGSGQITSVDVRSVNFAQQTSKRLRFGFNISTSIGKSRPTSESSGGRGSQASGSRPQGSSGGGFVGGSSNPGPGGFGPPAPAGAATTPGGGAQAGEQQGGRRGFDPSAFAAMRERLCAAPKEGEAAAEPDLSGLPAPLLDRLKGEDGKPDPQKVAEFKQRICSANPNGFGGGQGGFAQIRQTICAAKEGEIPDLSGMPEQMLDRIKGEDGKVDPAKFAQFKQRICSSNPQGGGQQGANGEQRRGGFAGGPPPGGPPPGGPPPGGASGGPPRGGGNPIGFIMRGRGGGDGRGRMFVNLNYTLELENKVLIAPGVPELDLLHGDALTGGGTVRHSVQLEGGFFLQGKGLRFSGNYSGPSNVNGTGLPGSNDLHFGSLLTLDVRFFVDLGEQERLVSKVPFLSGSRMSFSVDNLFGSYRKVTDSNGTVPLSYQPGLIDPKGRYFKLEFRKLF